ncbi:TlyA family rRNA (cytidine-2'-O)-methyltransferase [Desulfuribacillus stibiiarsenatis]|uniref:TlyA family rRNA (Cytidine-2'-O)-methyltransferase n=1 Tax=Desulfuribacillus stibiiarsenatis TaxID=1390249 RepID=A0A1E5L6C1_9FIRM|nr:TlyA family RNA methyltransferase [Desulfuribacillus stibiiarsenatis]OEH85671.1 TlyA family rRNA (cytidine-2'-O)-methyltransferase [Desulfuribacillus stibiiarsenatis]
MAKERIDTALVNLGFFETREKAKAAIMAGIVYIGNERIDKPGEKVDVSKEIIVKGNIHPYVGRGGLKLEKALKHFALDVSGVVMIDIGASTGGFTDCALQNHAAKVYAVDVGYGQLDWKLRNHPDVIVLERTNFRHLAVDVLTVGSPNFATIDVSFISLKLIFPKLSEILVPESKVVCLIKPQFEAGKELVGKKGIVRDPKVHQQVIEDVISQATQFHLYLEDLTYSPITGGDGNIEFLALFQFRPNQLQNQRISYNNQCTESDDYRCTENMEAETINHIRNYESLIEKTINDAHNQLQS